MFRLFRVWADFLDAIFRWFKKIIEALENENRRQNRRLSIAAICPLNEILHVDRAVLGGVWAGGRGLTNNYE